MSSPDRLPDTAGSTGASSTPEQQPALGCLFRLFWMAFGNALLLVCAALIAKHKPWAFSAADVGYWAVVVLLLAARFVDIQRFQGETSNGQPATMAHLRRYAALLVAIAGGLWALAHSIVM